MSISRHAGERDNKINDKREGKHRSISRTKTHLDSGIKHKESRPDHPTPLDLGRKRFKELPFTPFRDNQKLSDDCSKKEPYVLTHPHSPSRSDDRRVRTRSEPRAQPIELNQTYRGSLIY
jgi:hypothetical protein